MKRMANLLVLLVAVLSLFNCGLSHSAELTLEVPEPGEFIHDHSDLLDQEVEEKINSICKSLQQEQKTQIIVITIDSTAEYGDKSANIAGFTKQFIGKYYAVRMQDGGNTEMGKIILFMIAKNEQKAHIVFGGDGWKVKHENRKRRILEDLVNPQIQKADYVAGIVQGVEELDKLSRGQSSWIGGQWLWKFIAFVVGAILLVAFLVLRARSASSEVPSAKVQKPEYYSKNTGEIARKEMRTDLEDADVYLDRGLANDKLNWFDKAIADYNEAIRLNPNLTLAYIARGRAWINKSKSDIAIDDFNEAIRLSPEDAEAYYCRGLAWKTEGDMAKAEADFKKVEELYKKQMG